MYCSLMSLCFLQFRRPVVRDVATVLFGSNKCTLQWKLVKKLEGSDESFLFDHSHPLFWKIPQSPLSETPADVVVASMKGQSIFKLTQSGLNYDVVHFQEKWQIANLDQIKLGIRIFEDFIKNLNKE